MMLRAADQVAMRAEERETTHRAVAALARDIHFLVRATWAGSGERSFVFAGTPDRILFARGVAQANGLRGTAAVVIQSLAAAPGSRLLRAEAPLLPGTPSLQDLRFSPAREIYDGRAVIRFAYFGRAAESAAEVLVDTWPSETALPSAVRIGIVDPASGRLLSSLRVPIPIEAEPGCAAPEVAFCSRAERRKPPQGRASFAPGTGGTAPRQP